MILYMIEAFECTFGFRASPLLQETCHVPHTMPKCILCEVHCVLGSNPVGFESVFNVSTAEEGNDHGTSSFREGRDLEDGEQIDHGG